MPKSKAKTLPEIEELNDAPESTEEPEQFPSVETTEEEDEARVDEETVVESDPDTERESGKAEELELMRPGQPVAQSTSTPTPDASPAPAEPAEEKMIEVKILKNWHTKIGDTEYNLIAGQKITIPESHARTLNRRPGLVTIW